MVDTARVVEVLGNLVVFGPDQAGAYREMFGPVADVLGADVQTKLQRWLQGWARAGTPGLVIMTGNAGTGKTAAMQHYCEALGGSLPHSDELTDVRGALVVKDASGIASRAARAAMMRLALSEAKKRQILVCANEGVLRDAAEDLSEDHPQALKQLERSLHVGAVSSDGVTVVNLNRQRLTSRGLWDRMLDYVTREELWTGCEGCPGGNSHGACPMRANAAALRDESTREALRGLVRLASGSVVPTMREVLALLSYAVCGNGSAWGGMVNLWSCGDVIDRYRDRGAAAFTSTSAFYNLMFGDGLDAESVEQSPLLGALRRLGVGTVADLEVDGWLRDPTNASARVRRLAGMPPHGGVNMLEGSFSHLDRVPTEIGEATFGVLGEIVTISEDSTKVLACVKAMVNEPAPALSGWRRRVLLEANELVQGPYCAVSRLTALSFAPALMELAEAVARSDDYVTELTTIVRGLNFLSTGHADSSEGLIVADPASLFARNPGAFRAARPAFVHSTVPVSGLELSVPDQGLVTEMLDTDHIEVVLRLRGDSSTQLVIGPRLYQDIREAELFRGPVGQGTTEMTDLRGFYGLLAASPDLVREEGLRVADPVRGALVRIQLPHFATYD